MPIVNDVEICLGFDLASLGDGAPAESVSALHDALIAGYGTDDGRVTVRGSALGSVARK